MYVNLVAYYKIISLRKQGLDNVVIRRQEKQTNIFSRVNYKRMNEQKGF